MSQQPFFTIGIPTHNRAAFLRQAIDSALRQTHADLELVVSDNASTDDTPAIVAGIKDPRLRFARQTENIGALRNMNFLIDQARGRFFVLHQDDDLLHPEFLARCRLALGERSDISLFATAVLSGAEPEGVLGEQLCFRDPPWQPLSWLSDQPAVIGGVDAAIMQLFSLPFIPPGVAFNSEALRKTGRFFAGFNWAGDNVTLARVALCGPVLYDGRVGAFLRMHADNFSRQLSTRIRQACRREANRIILGYLDRSAPGWPERIRVCLGHLPERKRWKFLAEAWEGNYPGVLKQLLAESVAGPGRWGQFIVHLAAICWKGKLSRVVRSHFFPIEPWR